jgi:SWI/SNF-related matrix-associated actin-dependent regulator 1 of chromatin subfamily A
MEKWLCRKMSVEIAEGDFSMADVMIVNYNVLKKYHDQIRSIEWDCLIVDECTMVKSKKSQRGAEVWGRNKKGNKDYVSKIEARFIVALTGTPIPNRPIELWPIVHGIAPKSFPNWVSFVETFCDGRQTRYGWETNGASNLDVLQAELRASLMVRRLKCDVLKDLPLIRRTIMVIPADGCRKQIEIEKKIEQDSINNVERLQVLAEMAKSEGEEEYLKAIDNLKEGNRIAFTSMAKIRHDTAVIKIPYAVDAISDILDSGVDKIAVFAWHHDVVDGIMSGLAEYNPVVLTGKNSIEEKQASVDSFQIDKTVRVFVGSITAAGSGITLTASSNVAIVEFDWVPANMSQVEARCNRIGSTGKSTNVYYIALDGSLDQKLATTVVDKLNIISAALDGGGKCYDDVIGDINQHDFDVVDSMSNPKEDSLPATKRVRRDQIEEISKKIDESDIEIIHTCLLKLKGFDFDHANIRNGMGFSKVDVVIGHELADKVSLTAKQAALGFVICKKYRRQCPEILNVSILKEVSV